jgi:hypothetical protein
MEAEARDQLRAEDRRSANRMRRALGMRYSVVGAGCRPPPAGGDMALRRYAVIRAERIIRRLPTHDRRFGHRSGGERRDRELPARAIGPHRRLFRGNGVAGSDPMAVRNVYLGGAFRVLRPLSRSPRAR